MKKIGERTLNKQPKPLPQIRKRVGTEICFLLATKIVAAIKGAKVVPFSNSIGQLLPRDLSNARQKRYFGGHKNMQIMSTSYEGGPWLGRGQIKSRTRKLRPDPDASFGFVPSN